MTYVVVIWLCTTRVYEFWESTAANRSELRDQIAKGAANYEEQCRVIFKTLRP